MMSAYYNNKIEDSMIGLVDAKRRKKKLFDETLTEKQDRIIRKLRVNLVDKPVFINFCTQFGFKSRNNALRNAEVMAAFATYILEGNN
jgi:hypothetical protein